MRNEWFGGDITGGGSNSKSAYMLFYERVESMQSPAPRIGLQSLSEDIRQVIKEESDSFLRKKIYSDSSSLRFLTNLINKFDSEEGLNSLEALLVDRDSNTLRDDALFQFIKNLRVSSNNHRALCLTNWQPDTPSSMTWLPIPAM